MESQSEERGFVVDIDGFEGPIDVLLTLAREQKVDLTRISILQLADQYLDFVAEAKLVSLELAADYLVMAAWLAYIKSRLLLPDLGDEGEPSGEEMAAALTYQLRRLEAMQDAGARLMGRAQLGREFFPRGRPEFFAAVTEARLDATLFDLLKAYGGIQRRAPGGTLHLEPWQLYSVEDVLERLRRLLGATKDWESLWSFLPPGSGLTARSALASTFAASLEMAREGELRIRQSGGPFGPLYLRLAKGRGNE
ncbi:MAG: segregation/condensation protein A [Proteobacteria bacterium]|nr:segregation/condensation protein A [Pseudomonadota bacterium]